MRFGIYTNLTRDENGKATIQLADFFKSKNIPFAMSEELYSLAYACEYLSNEALAQQSDVVIIFGGDGTILRIVKECAKADCAIFAINLGSLGFLTEIENLEVCQAIDEICKNQITIEKRSLLEVSYKNKTFSALNEVVIARGSRTKMIYIDLMVNNILVDRLRSDGIIISSPTGSTAYSLSAGGPIVTPDVAAFIMTPICPHSFHSRPFVISNESTIKLYLMRADPSAFLNVDGEDMVEMEVGDVVEVKKSNLTAKFLRLQSYNFYDNIIQKLNYWRHTDRE